MTVARPVQESAFPSIAPARPVGPIPASVQTGLNADLIARIAPLYLTGSVLDVTYGEGNWWTRYRPDRFTAHDLDPAKGDGVDFRHLPEADHSIDTVCFDPPYIPQGGYETSTVKSFADNFGLISRSRTELNDLHRLGLAECARVARQWVLVKCTDYVVGGSFRLGHVQMIDTAKFIGLGDPWDLIIHHTGSGPGGHNIFTPVRARRHHSYLLVWKVAA